MMEIGARLKASGYHLLLSALVALLVASAVFFLWYPWPYSQICGGLNLMTLLISVDLILGPLLTLVVFDKRKRRAVLIRDLSFIGLMQVAALTYGAHTVFIARPVALVFEGVRFRVVTNVEVADSELPKAAPALRTLSITGPKLLGTRVPTNDEKFEAFSLAMAGVDLGARPSYWVPFQEVKGRVLEASKPVNLLQKKYPQFANELDTQIRKSGRSADQIRYLPMISRNAMWTILLDATTAEPVGFLPKDV